MTSCASCGFIHMFEDTPEFVARHIIREAKSLPDSLAPPFFRALVHYANDASYSGTAPGHPVAWHSWKSPIGQMFHQFFGETCYAPTSVNVVEELGQLLIITGPVAASGTQCSAYFQRRPPLLRHQRYIHVQQNGMALPPWRRATSWWSIVTATSRFCTPSSCAARSVFLMPTRNHLGIIGPIPWKNFPWKAFKRKSRQTHFARAAKIRSHVF